METSVFNSSSKTTPSLEDLKKLGFYQTPEKFIKQNSDRMGLEKKFKKLHNKRMSFVYVSPFSNITLFLLSDSSTAFIDVVSDRNEIIFEERFHCSKTEGLIDSVYKSLSSLKEVIDDQLICNYENCKKQPKIVKNKKGIYYWLCPANHTHKKNQY